MYLKQKRNETFNNAYLKKLFFGFLGAYILLVIAFYFLAGYQLHFRESRGNLEIPAAESGTIELVQGAVVEQVFTVEIQRLQSIQVQWGTYMRANVGTIHMELYDLRDQSLIMQQTLDAATISDGMVTTMSVTTPIETVYMAPLLLRIYADSMPGSAVCPMMSATAEKEGYTLSLNGSQVDGMLCFSASGEDYIWTGLHYWEFAVVFGLILVAYLVMVYRCWQSGKKSLLINALTAMNKYRFLIKQLVSRDFKAKYKRSILGVFWSFLNPLLTMIVQYIVFSNLFRFDIPHYPVYLLSGIIVFNYFSEACGMALTSIIGNASLITKVYVPKYIYPLTRILSSLVNLLISMIPLIIVTIFSGLYPRAVYLLIPFMLVCLTMFCLGLGMLLSAAMVFFRDIQFLWGVLTMIWMYLTPIFYPESILPNEVAWILKFNPLYYFISFLRSCVIEGVSPEPIIYVQCFLIALGVLAIGAFTFKKSQDKFVLYL